MRSFSFQNIEITQDSSPYLIAEIGVNHEGSLAKAKNLIDLAKQGGAQAAKFQTYKAETLASKQSPAYWDISKEKTLSQYELFKKYDFFERKDYEELASYCEKVGIHFLSTPFDVGAVDFLDSLVPFFKIASADLTNIPLLKKVAQTNKPILLSTGACRKGEVRRVVEFLNQSGCNQISLMHCILNYPTDFRNAHLNMIIDLLEEFPNLLIGYSDHTPPTRALSVLQTAYLKGARILEKHFTYDKNLLGNDHYHAMDAEDLQSFFVEIDFIRQLEGENKKRVLESESIARKNARRSLVAAKNLDAGTILSEKDLISKRPGTGLSPWILNSDIKLRTKMQVLEDVLLTSENIEYLVKDKKTVAIIQARYASTRLPHKAIEVLGQDLFLLEWVIKRLKCSKLINHIVLAIPDTQENDVLAEIAKKYDIGVFRGSENDVLSRFYEAARSCSADSVVRVCADNPFIDPVEVDRLIEFYNNNCPEYAFNHIPKLENEYPDGFGAEIFPFYILDEMYRDALLPSEREHCTLHIWNHSHCFDIRTFKAPEEIKGVNIKFDVDTKEDLEFLRKIAEKIQVNSSSFEIIQVCKKILME